MHAQSNPLNEIEAFVEQVFAAVEVEREQADEAPAFLPDDPVAWIEQEFFIPETGAAIKLEPYQRAVVREALRRDENGLFAYSLVLWSDVKKSAKSTIAAAVCLYLAWHTSWETVRVVGNDLKQANSRTFWYIERAIKLNPRLRARCAIRNYKISLPNNTTIEAIAVDPKGEAGGGDLIVCFTELWAAKNEAAKQLWTETTLSPLKYGRSIRWCESYAGFEGESPILEQLYEQGVKSGALVDVGIEGLELFRNDAAKMLALWNTQPRCTWQTPQYYAQESATLTESEFNRVHRNVWASSTDAFVPIEWWDACKGELPPLRRNQELVLAADAGVSSDCFALVAVSRAGEFVHVRYVRIWTPPKGGTILFSNPANFDDPSTPEGEIRRLCREYNIVSVVYDKHQLHDMMTRLRREGVAACKEFDQNDRRLVADKQLYDLIRERRIVHQGEPDLREHIQNANRYTPTTPQSVDKLRLVKRDEKRKIDAAVCASMAANEAKRLNLG